MCEKVAGTSSSSDWLLVDAGGGVVVDLDEDGNEVYSERKVRGRPRPVETHTLKSHCGTKAAAKPSEGTPQSDNRKIVKSKTLSKKKEKLGEICLPGRQQGLG